MSVMTDNQITLSIHTYSCTDGNADIEIDAETPQEAAQEYVDGGDWGDSDSTQWISVWVSGGDLDEGDSERITITIEPNEPDCTGERDGHEWTAPWDVVGGLKESPGVYGHGGGVTIREVCMHCGCGRLTDTWAQDPSTGEQGLTSVSYDPDWLADCDQETS